MILARACRVWAVVALVGCAPTPDVGAVVAASHECSVPTDPCDDGDPCTTDRCDVVGRVCQHSPIPSCCADVFDCAPVPCAMPVCELARCMYRAEPACEAGSPLFDAAPPDLDAGLLDAGEAIPDAAVIMDASPPDDASEVDASQVPRIRGGACSIALGPRTSGWWVIALAVGLWLRGRRIGLVALGLVIAGLAIPAAAQPRFRVGLPTAHLPSDLGTLERAAPEPAELRFGARIGARYVEDPLVAETGDGEVRLVGERLSIGGAASIAFLERAFVSVSGSFHVQGGTGLRGIDAAGAALESPAVGPPGLDARVVILDRSDPFELALATTLRLPFGASSGFAIDTDASVWPRLLAAKAFDPEGSFVGLSIGVDVRPEARLGTLEVGPMLTLVAGGAVAVGSQAALTLEVSAATVLARAFDGPHTPLAASLGVRWLEDPFCVTAWVGAGLSPGFGAPDVLLGLAFGSWIPV